MTTAVLRAKAIDLIALVKPRIMVMALLTAAGATSLAPGTAAIGTTLWLLAGTALIVGAANTLNMWLERDIDCLMSRTKERPLPQRRLAGAHRAVVRRRPGRARRCRCSRWSTS